MTEDEHDGFDEDGGRSVIFAYAMIGIGLAVIVSGLIAQ